MYIIIKYVCVENHEFLLELEHIHNKVVFDAVNEALDQHRPYGLKGQPFPWKVDSTKLVPRYQHL